MNINVRGTIDTVRQFLAHLAKVDPSSPDNERGVVVLVASVAALEGQKGQVAYGASKGAVASMTLPMARDLSRYGIRVVTIAPGIFSSPMEAAMSEKTRAQLLKATEYPPRQGQPTEFAQIVQQAIENVMLNGTVLRLDGALRLPSKF